DRIAALHHDAQSGLRRERLARRYDAVLRHHFGAALELPAFGTVAPDRSAGGSLRFGIADRERGQRLRGGKSREEGRGKESEGERETAREHRASSGVAIGPPKRGLYRRLIPPSKPLSAEGRRDRKTIARWYG